jgi:Fur family ferric uptake transcriptional regulator
MSCFQTLKEKGYKLTPQRVAVLQVLHESDEHITAADICERVQARYPHINKSTVYQTLELMKQLRLVTETDLGGDRLCYHHAEKGYHHHLICQRYGRVTDLDEAALTPLKELLTSKYNFIPEIRHLAIFGRCLNCRE